MNETEIIRRCKAGDSSGFKALVNQYSSKMMGISVRYMRNTEVAKDVLQDSFIQIFKHISSFESIGSFEGWISKIVVRTALMAIRKNKNNIVFLEPTITDNLNDKSINIENELDENDILRMIKKLPEHYRIIFNLYIIEGYSHAEIGELMGISESTSRTKLTRARKKMKLIYAETMDGPKTKNYLQ